MHMEHRDDTLRQKACLTALRTVLDESVVMNALGDLEERLGNHFSGFHDRSDPRLQTAVEALACCYLLDEQKATLLADALFKTFQVDAATVQRGNLSSAQPSSWAEIQAMRGMPRSTRPVAAEAQPAPQPAARATPEPATQVNQPVDFSSFMVLTDEYWRHLLLSRMKQWFFYFNQGWVKLNRRF